MRDPHIDAQYAVLQEIMRDLWAAIEHSDMDYLHVSLSGDMSPAKSRHEHSYTCHIIDAVLTHKYCDPHMAVDHDALGLYAAILNQEFGTDTPFPPDGMQQPKRRAWIKRCAVQIPYLKEHQYA